MTWIRSKISQLYVRLSPSTLLGWAQKLRIDTTPVLLVHDGRTSTIQALRYRQGLLIVTL